MGSPSENSFVTVNGGCRPIPSLDPERCLIVELEPDEREAILAAGTARGGPVTFQLQITYRRRDAKGFVYVDGELEPSDLPPDFSSIDLEDGPLGLLDEEPE